MDLSFLKNLIPPNLTGLVMHYLVVMEYSQECIAKKIAIINKWEIAFYKGEESQ